MLARPPVPRPHPALPPGAAEDLIDAVAAVRLRSQQTRRRLGRVVRLDRARIAADLAAIEAQADRLGALLGSLRDGRA
jgi:hypothetical protein